MPTNAPATAAVLMMDKTQAKEARDKINNHMGSAVALLKDFYHREGWKALGYKSFKDCAEKEFGHGRARVYQLLNEGKIQSELQESGPMPALSSRATRELGAAPAGKRNAALKAAQKEHRTDTPSAPQIKKTVTSRWAKSGVTPKKKATKPAKSVSELAKDDDELKRALAVLGGTVHRDFRKAIEDGAIELTRKEIVQLSEESDEIMQSAARLITALKWPLKRALSFLDAMPTLQTKLEELTWHAIAAPETWEGIFGAFKVTIEVNRKKL